MSEPRRLRVRIEKADREPVHSTKITDAETGDEVTHVFAFSLRAEIGDGFVYCTLSRYQEPLRYDKALDGIPTYQQEVQVVHLDTDAIEVEPCSSSTPSAATDQPSTAESDQT